MQEFKPFKEGKVREVYDNGDSLIMVATDRISAFDHILKNKITDKGAILTQMSKFWFEFTKDVVPNHMISVDAKDMPEFFGQDRFNGNSMLCKKLEMLPIECIVRGLVLFRIQGAKYQLYNYPPAIKARAIEKGITTQAELDAHAKKNRVFGLFV